MSDTHSKIITPSVTNLYISAAYSFSGIVIFDSTPKMGPNVIWSCYLGIIFSHTAHMSDLIQCNQIARIRLSRNVVKCGECLSYKPRTCTCINFTFMGPNYMSHRSNLEVFLCWKPRTGFDSRCTPANGQKALWESLLREQNALTRSKWPVDVELNLPTLYAIRAFAISTNGRNGCSDSIEMQSL